MILPEDEQDLADFCSAAIADCFASRYDRMQLYTDRRSYFLYGTRGGDQAWYNRCWSHLDALTSFLYSAETCKFYVGPDREIDPKYEETVIKQSEVMTSRLNRKYHDSGTAGIVGEAILWALVYDTMLVKQRWNRQRNTVDSFLVEPHNFGVANESIKELDRQPYFAHRYLMSVSEFVARIRHMKGWEEKLGRVDKHRESMSDSGSLPQSITRLIVTSTSPNLVGAANPNWTAVPQYKPRIGLSHVECYELWVQDDAIQDWRCITVVAPDVVLYNPPSNIFLPGEQPFTNITPNPIYDFFWGASELDILMKLQDWSNERIEQVRELLNLQVDPAMSLAGMSGIQDEKSVAQRMRGARYSSELPTAEAKIIMPDIPPDIFAEINMIGRFFEEASGMTGLLQGRNESGVRSKEQVGALAKLGSSRIRKKALRVEKPIEKIGDNIMGLMARHDDATMRAVTKGGELPFVAAQFGEDYCVKVDSHSASPIFVDDHVQLAFALRKAGAIDGQSLLELTGPPMENILQARLKEMLRAQAKAKQAELAANPGGSHPPAKRRSS